LVVAGRWLVRAARPLADTTHRRNAITANHHPSKDPAKMVRGMGGAMRHERLLRRLYDERVTLYF
jgi:hypothetical protein